MNKRILCKFTILVLKNQDDWIQSVCQEKDGRRELHYREQAEDWQEVSEADRQAVEADL